MILQVSMLKPSVLMSVPVEKEEDRKSKLQLQRCSMLMLQLTFGHDLVHDGPQLHCRDLHVLEHKPPVSRQSTHRLLCDVTKHKLTGPASLEKSPLNPESTSASDTVSWIQTP